MIHFTLRPTFRTFADKETGNITAFTFPSAYRLYQASQASIPDNS